MRQRSSNMQLLDAYGCRGRKAGKWQCNKPVKSGYETKFQTLHSIVHFNLYFECWVAVFWTCTIGAGPPTSIKKQF